MAAVPEIRRTFRDPDRQEAFSTLGYTVIDLLSTDEAAALAQRFVALYSGSTEGFHSSLESPDYAYRDRLHDELVRTLGHLFDDWFDDHDVVMAAATVKWRGGESTVDIHQDWSFVDEAHYRTFNLWIPLVETDDENGRLYVLPGSHDEHRKLRIHGGFPSWYEDPAWQLDRETFTPVEVRPGQALVTDHSLLHRSPPNRSDVDRIAVVVVLKPVEATLYHWYLSSDDEIIRYQIDDIEFFRRIVAMQDPSHVLAGLPSEIVEFDRPRPGPSGDARGEAAGPPPGHGADRDGALAGDGPDDTGGPGTASREAATSAEVPASGGGSGAPTSGREPFWRHLGRRARHVTGKR